MPYDDLKPDEYHKCLLHILQNQNFYSMYNTHLKHHYMPSQKLLQYFDRLYLCSCEYANASQWLFASCWSAYPVFRVLLATDYITLVNIPRYLYHSDCIY